MMDATGIGGVDSPMPSSEKSLEQNALKVYNLSQEELAKKFRGGRTVAEEKKNKYASQDRWRAKNERQFAFHFNKNADGDIIDLLDCAGKDKINVARKAFRLYIEKENEK